MKNGRRAYSSTSEMTPLMRLQIAQMEAERAEREYALLLATIDAPLQEMVRTGDPRVASLVDLERRCRDSWAEMEEARRELKRSNTTNN